MPKLYIRNAMSNLKFIIEENLEAKVRPPFPKLPIFNVAATILSYYGYNDKVRRLLKGVSRNTRKYFLCHKEILKAFIKVWKPKAAIDFGTLSFGRINQANVNVQWGCNKDWKPP